MQVDCLDQKAKRQNKGRGKPTSSALKSACFFLKCVHFGLLSIYIILKMEKEKNQLVKADNQKHISFLTQTTYTRPEMREGKLETGPK